MVEQGKPLGRMGKVVKKGRTILFDSNMVMIENLCQSALLIPSKMPINWAFFDVFRKMEVLKNF